MMIGEGLLTATLYAIACGASFAAGGPPERADAGANAAALLSSGFEDGLAGWTTEGAGEFAADRSEHRGGEQSARIMVPAATAIHYQQLQRVIKGAAMGDRLAASVWVRTRGLADGAGAYMAVEFLGAGGQRVDIAHSKVSRTTGRDGWERLTAEAVMPEVAAVARMALVLHAHGTAWFDDAEVTVEKFEPWPDMGDAERQVTIRTSRVVQPAFGGVGFDVFDHIHEAGPQLLADVIEKRWRELAPSFARLYHDCNWDRAMLDKVAERLARFQRTGTELCVTTWNPQDVRTPEALAAYARKIVDDLEYLVRTKGLTNIRVYCMTNELQLRYWGELKDDLPRFKAYNQALFDELASRKLEIGLLATDASPVSAWDTIEWATTNMDAITAVYGGHHYIAEYTLGDERFYPWFLGKMSWATGLARQRGKNFILGEFGCKQNPPERTVGGRKMDACAYWDTPEEPLVAIQLAEATLAAINGGIHQMGYWTFADFPDTFPSAGGVPASNSYANKWGVFRWSGSDSSTRAHYYGYGLLTKFFRGPATVYEVSTSDPRLRVAALRRQGQGSWSIAVVNRNRRAVRVALVIEGAGPSSAFRKYVYDPRAVPQHPFGDLQGPESRVRMEDGRLDDGLRPMTLNLYTNACDDDPPAAVQGMKVEAIAGGRLHVTWHPSSEGDFCYYRVFRSDQAEFTPQVQTQIGSTIVTEFVDKPGEVGKDRYYRVLAVDTSGNASR